MSRRSTRSLDRLSWYAYFPSDFEEGTSDFSLAEVGAYQRLMNSQWAKTGIPGDHIHKIAAILRCAPATAKAVWKTVAPKFVRGEDGLWRNARLAQERQIAIDAKNAAQENGTLGARRRWGSDSDPISVATCSPVANRSRPQWRNDSSPDPEDLVKEQPDLPPKSPHASDQVRGRFEVFWAEYPKKKARGAAWKVWQRIKPSAELTSDMLTAIRAQRAGRSWREGFIPNPATWLNGECWTDEIDGRLADPGAPVIPFWDECPTCGDIHPITGTCTRTPIPVAVHGERT